MRLIGAGRPVSRAADPGDELIPRLTALASALDGEPDPGWENSTRERLVAMAAVRTPEPGPASPLRRLLARREGRPGVWRSRLTVGLTGVAAAVTAVAAVVTLSADARPGDALYGFKRGTEQTQLALAGDARGRTLLGFASTRLEELSAVLAENPSPDLVVDTLATMDEETADGAAWLTRRALDLGSGAPLEELAGWAAAQAAALVDVLSEVPAVAEDDAADSGDLLSRIDERVAALQVALDCPAGPATDGSDVLGPVPVPCAAPAPTDGGSARTDPGPAPGTPAAPTPGDPAAPTTAPGGGTGSGDPDEGTGTGSGTGPGAGGDPGIPELRPTTPGRPDLPVPDLPTLFPGPEGTVRPPAPALPDVEVCLPDLPVLGDC